MSGTICIEHSQGRVAKTLPWRCQRGAEERSALLRSTFAGRQVLIPLDNARDANQIPPLPPGTDSLVIVTPSNQLRGLSIRNGAHDKTASGTAGGAMRRCR